MKFEDALKKASSNSKAEPDICAWPIGTQVPFGFGIPLLHLLQQKCVEGKRVFGRQPDAHLGAVGE